MADNIISNEGEIVLYQPDESIQLEVKLDAKLETVWLNRRQMAELFGRDVKTIGKHIANALKEELSTMSPPVNDSTIQEHSSVVAKFATTASDGKSYQVEYYNLDMVLSVGYRVKSNKGIQFRRWATGVLKEYLLRGYSINHQLIQMEERIDHKLLTQHNEIQQLKQTQNKQQKQLDFFITTSTPPAEMVFFEGDFYKARVALENLVKTAKHRVIIVDGYINSLTLSILDVRKSGVSGIIYTNSAGSGIQNLMAEHDRLFPSAHIDIRKWRNESHDRWLIIDDKLYHCGHSLNANGGHKISAITLMGISPDVILEKM